MKRIIPSKEIGKLPGCESELDIQPEFFKIIHSVAIYSVVVLIIIDIYDAVRGK